MHAYIHIYIYMYIYIYIYISYLAERLHLLRLNENATNNSGSRAGTLRVATMLYGLSETV